MKFRVTEIVQRACEYEVEASSHQEARDKVRQGKAGECLRTKTLDTTYESANLSLIRVNKI